ncbi:hypothetical protein T310_9887 [Rasamsonia emersonii CBS 393.64]|uniref:Cytochrome P450 n=1 Tax=Rasamsonia emersonii (strain ATCC 16479 / CBS 393.64 / IMI 116815) TaxID=1408163 RepID=A0A0F4YEA0_RASE3|nr:hypothetical protein T310_9887 [Rasamsonia emersonii CBS 393.64]KKA16514.1 hypothetical protein T310_9887 [Rasamsonia emersonii CBS 393.64]
MGFTQTLMQLLFRENFSIAIQSILVGLITTYVLSSLLSHHYNRVKAPRVGKNPWISGLVRARSDFVRNGKDLTKEGYIRYKDSMYWIQTGDMERLVLSNRYLDELRKLPDSHIDSKAAVVERNLGWYNRVDIILKSTAHVDVCRTQLVQNLDFHFYNAAATILNIVNRSAAKSLVGEPLCHDDKWLRTSLETTVNTGMLCRNLQKCPAILRPLICPFTAARKNLDRSFDVAQELLSGVIKDRQRGDKNVDILQWLIDSYKGDELSIPFLTNQTLFIAIASTRSTATSIVNAIFDLIAFSQYQQPLRQEIEEVLTESRGWNLSALKRMKRLDSFIKESQRLNHHILLSFNRKVRRKITLSDGVTIPPGTFICTPGYWAARDPEIFADGEDFKPWRWLELREAAEREGKSVTPYLASSTSPDNLHWGYGRNACPGRFMAAAEIKLILAWILWHFDISFPPGQSERPESLFVDERVIPCPTQEIGFRRRRT